jgi:hypothetical protein
LGRFLQEDTYKGDGLNLYADCKNNPVSYVDPSGYVACNKDALANARGQLLLPAPTERLMLPAPRKTVSETSVTVVKRPDFYVKPNGDIIPATGYRYMDSSHFYTTKINMTAPGSYIDFEKFESASSVRNAYQISPKWSDAKLRGEFDVLQLVDDLYVPKTFGDKGKYLEPITVSYPEFGTGGYAQLKVDADFIIKLNEVKLLED